MSEDSKMAGGCDGKKKSFIQSFESLWLDLILDGVAAPQPGVDKKSFCFYLLLKSSGWWLGINTTNRHIRTSRFEIGFGPSCYNSLRATTYCNLIRVLVQSSNFKIEKRGQGSQCESSWVQVQVAQGLTEASDLPATPKTAVLPASIEPNV
jgi:hypothetical protein